jgi:hypothetical protein
MRMRGLEPPPGCPDTDLNRARLPIPPHPRTGRAADDTARTGCKRASRGLVRGPAGVGSEGRDGAGSEARRGACSRPIEARTRRAQSGRAAAGFRHDALLACGPLAAIVQGTRTPPSHGGNPGSNPGSGTTKGPSKPGPFACSGTDETAARRISLSRRATLDQVVPWTAGGRDDGGLGIRRAGPPKWRAVTVTMAPSGRKPCSLPGRGRECRCERCRSSRAGRFDSAQPQTG